MVRYLIRRLIQMVFLFLVFLTVTWFLLYILPGDSVAQKYAGNPNIPPDARAVALERLGLDQPVLIQFRNYMVNFFQGDLGVSFNQYPRPVIEIIGERFAAHPGSISCGSGHLLLGRVPGRKVPGLAAG